MISFSSLSEPQSMKIAQQPLTNDKLPSLMQLPPLMEAGVKPTGTYPKKMRHKPAFKNLHLNHSQPIRPKVDKSVLCESCNIRVNSQAIYESHCKGAKHLKRLTQIRSILTPASNNLNNSNTATLGQNPTNNSIPVPNPETVKSQIDQEVQMFNGLSIDKEIKKPEEDHSLICISDDEGPVPAKQPKLEATKTEPLPNHNITKENQPNQTTPIGIGPSIDTAPRFIKSASKSSSISSSNKLVVEYRCEICNINLVSDAQLQIHVNGSKHQKKLARTKQIPVGGSSSSSQVKLEPLEFKCEVCDLKLVSQQQLDAHVAGKKHQKKVAAGNLGKTVTSDKKCEDDEKYAHLNIAWDKYRILDEQSIPDPSMRGKFEFFCALCSKYMQKKPQLVDHLKCKRHHQKIYEKRQKDAGLSTQANPGTKNPRPKNKFVPKKINFVPGSGQGTLSSVNQPQSHSVGMNNQSLINYPVNPFYSNSQQQQNYKPELNLAGYKRKIPTGNQDSANGTKFQRMDNNTPYVSSNYGYGYGYGYGYPQPNFMNQ